MTFLDKLRKDAVETLKTGTVIDQYTWNVFCTMLKTFSPTGNFSADDFSADDLFRILTQCCAACRGGIHHDEEGGPCCGECAADRENSVDITPFVMKNYYHAHKKQYDDATDIWFSHGDIPVVYNYEVVDDCIPPVSLYELINTCARCSHPIPSQDVEHVLRYIV
jgi:hypothetical protein